MLATAKVSKDWLSATAKLLDYGLADPRGCEYRQVERVALPGAVEAHQQHVSVAFDGDRELLRRLCHGAAA